MARGVNKVILIGNLGADPETRYTSNQRAITNLSMATTRSWRDKQSNELHEETEWHRVVLFGRQAEVAQEYLRKGSQAYIEGRLQTRKWQDKNGQDRWSTEVIADELQLLGGRGGSTAPMGESGGQSRSRNQVSEPAGSAPPMGGGDFEDDIPF